MKGLRSSNDRPRHHLLDIFHNTSVSNTPTDDTSHDLLLADSTGILPPDESDPLRMSHF